MDGQDPRRARMHRQKGKMGSKGKVAKYREFYFKPKRKHQERMVIN